MYQYLIHKTMVCAVRYAIAIIHNYSREPLLNDTIKKVLTFHNDNVEYDIMLDTIDATETKYGTLVTAEVDNRDGSQQHTSTPIQSLVIKVWDDKGSASFMY